MHVVLYKEITCSAINWTSVLVRLKWFLQIQPESHFYKCLCISYCQDHTKHLTTLQWIGGPLQRDYIFSNKLDFSYRGIWEGFCNPVSHIYLQVSVHTALSRPYETLYTTAVDMWSFTKRLHVQ